MKTTKSFYERPEWRALRYRVLVKFGRKCLACGRTPESGIQIHVDHIKPKHIYPELALTEANLQVLCHDCNYGKGVDHLDDFRPAKTLPYTEAPDPDIGEPFKGIKQEIRNRIGSAIKQADVPSAAGWITEVIKFNGDMVKIEKKLITPAEAVIKWKTRLLEPLRPVETKGNESKG